MKKKFISFFNLKTYYDSLRKVNNHIITVSRFHVQQRRLISSLTDKEDNELIHNNCALIHSERGTDLLNGAFISDLEHDPVYRKQFSQFMFLTPVVKI